MADRVDILWYTDPHNVWCWGCEPAIRRLEVIYPEAVRIEVRMGGLFEDFEPVREQWARMSGGRWKDSVRAFFEAVAAQHRMPMDALRMAESVEDFDSTWPACIAVKAAGLQGAEAGRTYLRRLREAWIVEGRGIHRTSVQTEVARETGLDVDAFTRALDDGSAERAFDADLEMARSLDVTGFPTFEVRGGATTIRVDGWQPWEAFDDLVRRLLPDVPPVRVEASEATVADLLDRYGRCATREIAAILGVTDDDAEILLENLEGSGRVTRREVGTGLMWEPARAPPIEAQAAHEASR